MFLGFMTGGVIMTLIVLPLIRIAPLGKERRQLAFLASIRAVFATFMWVAPRLRLVSEFKVIGLEALKDKGPFLYIANHPSLIDVVALMSLTPRCNCLVKKELFHHPWFGGVLRGVGFIPNDSGPILIEAVKQGLEKGHSLVIFPEGTRSPQEGGLQPFNRGAANIAVRTGARIAPVLIRLNPRTLMKGQKWYEIPEKVVYIELRFLDPMTVPAEIENITEAPLKVRALNRHLETFFEEQLAALPEIR